MESARNDLSNTPQPGIRIAHGPRPFQEVTDIAHANVNNPGRVNT